MGNDKQVGLFLPLGSQTGALFQHAGWSFLLFRQVTAEQPLHRLNEELIKNHSLLLFIGHAFSHSFIKTHMYYRLSYV